jgi:uncharacterized protein YcfL
MKKLTLLGVLSTLLLAACQPKPEIESKDQPIKHAESIPVIQAQTQPIQLPKNEVCHPATAEESASCTKYHLQTIHSNVEWLNQYFEQRLKQEHAEAFQTTPASKVTLDPDMPSTNYSTASVRYIAQHYNIATFEYFSDYFPAGAAHGMHHSDYVVFDLSTQQRLTLNDILQAASKERLKAALFEHNLDWLEAHHIQLNDFQVSENFYFNATGIVFVYPLYELASYAEGMTQLELPYWALQDFIQTQYLPQLPESSEDIYQE